MGFNNDSPSSLGQGLTAPDSSSVKTVGAPLQNGGVAVSPAGRTKEHDDALPQISHVQDQHVEPATGEPRANGRSGGKQEKSGADHSILQAAWAAAVGGHESATVHGATITSPGLTLKPLARLLHPETSNGGFLPLLYTNAKQPPPDGFILTGTISLFGVDSLKADFYSHVPPERVDPSGIQPIYQMALTREDLPIPTIAPAFTGTKFDVVVLKNAVFTYQNMVLDMTKPVGYSFEGDVAFDGTYGRVNDILTRFLHIEEPKLHLSGPLDGEQDWHRPLHVSSFVLQGTFPDVHVTPFKGISFSGVGVKLSGSHVPEGTLTAANLKEFEYEVFGIMHLDIPGSATPLELDFDISEKDGNVELSAHLEGDWSNAFGVKGLRLQEVSLSTDLDFNNLLSDLTFKMAATVNAGKTSPQLRGSFSTKEEPSLTADVKDLGFGGLSDVYNHIFGGSLTIPKVSVHIGDATLNVSSNTGFKLLIHDLRVDNHTVSKAPIELGSNGVHIRAGIDEGKIAVGDFTITAAYVDVSLGRHEQDQKSNVLLGGKLEWHDSHFDVGVHLYQPREQGKGLEYTVYGEFLQSVKGGGLPLASLCPELKETFMRDITLQGAAIIIASRDDPEFGVLNLSNYPVRQGVQVCGAIGELEPLNSMMHPSKPPSLILSAGWSDKDGFDIEVIFPSPSKINLGRGITSDLFVLKIVTGSRPAMKMITGVKIPVPNTPAPLHFSLELALDELGATGTGHLSGGWKNPFGINDQLTIGPDLALSISLFYETFVATGIPAALGFVGGLQMGKVDAQLAFEVSDVPSREFLSASVAVLDIQDLAAVAKTITNMNLAQPPNVINFEKLALYICPAGVSIGDIHYPPGFSFSSETALFGTRGDVKVVVGAGGVHCIGGIDNFKLGALSVRGVNGPRPTFEIQMDTLKQAGYIDGMITLFDMETKLLCKFELHPRLSFDFDFNLQFADLFTFTVHAEPASQLTEQDHKIADMEYNLTATLHKTIRDHIAQQLNAMFDELARQQKEVADALIDHRQQARQHNLEVAKQTLEESHRIWKAKSGEIHAHFNSVIEEEKVQAARLQWTLDQESVRHKNDLATAQAAVTTATNRRAASLKANQDALRAKKVEWDAKIAEAHRTLDAATKILHSRFGDVESDVDDARAKVDTVQHCINGMTDDVKRCEAASWRDLPSKAAISGLYMEIGGLRATKAIADGVLKAAKAVLEGGDYLGSKAATKVASAALEAAKANGAAAIAVAEHALIVTDKATNENLAVVRAARDAVSRQGEAAVKLASVALEEHKARSLAALQAAQRSVDGLNSSTESVAHKAATDSLVSLKAANQRTTLLAREAVNINAAVEKIGAKSASWILSFVSQLIYITDITLTGELGNAVLGVPFDADVKGTIGRGHQFHIKTKFDTRDPNELMKEIFNQLVKMVEDDVVQIPGLPGLVPKH